jgi:hypothetical protein
MGNNTTTKNVKNSNTNTSNSTSNSSTTNELITAINSAKSSGTPVKAIRKQKHDPNNFYFTLTDGKQVGPVAVTGDQNELNRKFGEAQSFLNGTKSNQPTRTTNAA